MFHADPHGHLKSNDPKERVKRHILAPVVDYIIEELDEQRLIFHHLLRYKDRCECFTREDLAHSIARLEKEAVKKTKRHLVEDYLQADLYQYLHDQGIEFVIEPKLDRGRIDIIASIRGPDPKYVETKVFDGKGRKQGEVLDGFQQIFSYVRTHNATTGYLAIYNLSPHFIGLALDGAINPSLHYLKHSGATIYFLIINLFLHEQSVSQRGRYRETPITREQLVKTVT